MPFPSFCQIYNTSNGGGFETSQYLRKYFVSLFSIHAFLSIHLALLPYKQPKFFCGRKSGLWKISFTLVETLILLNCYWQKHPIFFTIIFWFSKITEKIAFFFFLMFISKIEPKKAQKQMAVYSVLKYTLSLIGFFFTLFHLHVMIMGHM